MTHNNIERARHAAARAARHPEQILNEAQSRMERLGEHHPSTEWVRNWLSRSDPPPPRASQSHGMVVRLVKKLWPDRAGQLP